jgi:putative nucleotidyltransferase with HDIG domain
MPASKITTRLFWLAEAILLVGAVATAVLTSRAEDWQPLQLVVLLMALALGGQRLSITLRGQQITTAFIALVLAMTLLGPAPAALFGVAAMVWASTTRRLPPAAWLNNLATFAVFPVVGGLLVRALVGTLIGNVHHPDAGEITDGVTFALVVFAVFMLMNVLNFVLIAIDNRVLEGRPLSSQIRDVLVPILPGQIAAGGLTAILAVAYATLGFPVLLCAVLVILIFQYLAMALLRSEDRADQLEARSMHLASLQLGVLTTLVETLALRDRVTARHAAAVARYARALAQEAGCSESEQDLVHTAGLLHDIGKFALPDRILNAEILSDEDWALIRRHPQDGATLVGRLDGYGPVADAILYHHEHIDGSGYPAGLIGNEIPLPSRILAICSAYDTMTSRDSYRSAKTPQDAIAELRRMSGRQFDEELVNSFVAMLERNGPAKLAAGEEADFEAELAFERRARAIAQPTAR